MTEVIMPHDMNTHYFAARSPPECTNLVELIAFIEVQSTVTTNYSTWIFLRLDRLFTKTKVYCFSSDENYTGHSWHFVSKEASRSSFGCKFIIKPFKFHRLEILRHLSPFRGNRLSSWTHTWVIGFKQYYTTLRLFTTGISFHRQCLK